MLEYIDFFLGYETYIYIASFVLIVVFSLLKNYVFLIEKFFIVLMAFLAGAKFLGLWEITLVLLLGSIVGDVSAYFLGKNNGRTIITFLKRDDKKKALKFLKKYSFKSFFLAKFLNIYPGLTAFLGGYRRMSLKDFLKYDIPGVLIEVLGYVILGYLLGFYFDLIENKLLFFIESFSVLIIFSLVLFMYFYTKLKGRVKRGNIKKIIEIKKRQLIKIIIKKTFYHLFLVGVFYFVVLYLMFFVFEGNIRTQNNFSVYDSLQEVNKQLPLKTFFQKKSSFTGNVSEYQPINVIMVTSRDIDKVFEEIGWIKSKMFGVDKINLRGFLSDLRKKKLPMSNMYLNKRVQTHSFQNRSSSLRKREHIRLWRVGYLKDRDKKVYMGSITKDIGIDLTIYRGFFVPLHEIDPNIDKSRDLLLELTEKNFKDLEYEYLDRGDRVKKNPGENRYFYTDGKLLLLRIPGK